MANAGDSRTGWKREAAALAAGLLLGSAWQAAQAGVRIAPWPALRAAAQPLVTWHPATWHKRAR